MEFSLYEWILVILDIFGTYITYKFMKVFFDTRRTSKRIEFLTYVLFYLFSTGMFLFVNIPVAFIIYNLVAVFALSYNYEGSLNTHILSTLFMYLIMATVEVVVGLVTGYLDFSLFSLNTYSSIFGLIACRIISYAVVLMLANFKNIKTGETVQNSNWISIALIPIASLYLTLLLFQAREITEIQILVGVIFIILINFSTFYLYDVITAALSDKMKNRLILEQNKYYDNQLEMIKSSLQTTNAIRHDLKNHMFSIRTLMENGDTKESLNYIFKIMDDIGTRKDYSTSGNTVIDSIINFKFQEADQRGIKTDLDIKIPERLEIPSFDITIILGNLLDNAIKAASEVKENRFINIRIKFDKGRLQIEVENSYAGVINEEKGKFLTSHIDKKNHGIGLETVKKTVQKYNGTMKIDYNDTIFAIFLFMYVD